MSETGNTTLCPYCGHLQPAATPASPPARCQQCGGLFEPLSRRATQIAMGPWFIRDAQKPFRPGCSFEVLRKQIDAGRVKPDSVLRGPTTQQFWAQARHIPGVAHLLGFCHECGARVSKTAEKCPDCGVVFAAPEARNELGLRYPTAEEAAAAQEEINRIIAGQQADEEADEPDAPGSKPEANRTGDRAENRGASRNAPRAPRRGPRRVVLPADDLLDQIVGPARQRLSPMSPASGEGASTRKRDGQVPVVVVRPIGAPAAGGGSVSAGASGSAGDVGSRGEAAPSTGATSSSSAGDDSAGTALDFTPSEGAPLPLHQAPRRNTLTIVLLLAVALVLGFYAFYVTLQLSRGVETKPPPSLPTNSTREIGSRPAAPADPGTSADVRPPTPSAAPGLTRPATTPSLPADFPLAPARKVEPAPAPAPPAGNAPPDRGGARRSGDSRAGESRTGETRAQEPKPNLFNAPPSAATVTQRLAQATRLEESGKLSDALTIVEDLARNFNDKNRPPELTSALARLRDRVQKENARKAFED